MDNLIVLFILLAACAVAEPHTMNWEHQRDRSIRIVQANYRHRVKRDSTALSDNVLQQIGDQLDHAQSNLAYCEFGAYLEYLSLQCEPEKFLNLRNGIDDVNKPPELKMMALLSSAIAVGCKETALYLCNLLIQNYKNQNEGSQRCISSTIRGPKESELIPCDGKTAELIKEQFGPSKKLTFMYHITSSPLFLTLGCHSLGKVSVEDLSNDLDLKITKGSRIQNMTVFSIETNLPNENKDTLIMNYVYQHKSDIQITESLIQSMEKTGHLDTDNLTIVDGVNFTSESVQNRPKRSANERNIEDYFSVKHGCSIASSLSVRLDSVSKSACLQFCVDDKSCRSAGYTNDNSEWCQLNTEIRQDVGPFFTCGRGESSEWDYFEKKSEPVYFLISSKTRGDVLEASSPTSVKIKPFNGKEHQFWFWKDDTIYSKKYAQKALTINPKRFDDGYRGYRFDEGKIVLENNNNTKTQKWNFAKETLTSQYENLNIYIEDGQPEVLVSRLVFQKWSLSLDRYYFVITNRYSGKVLEASKENQSEGRVTMGSYHGGVNQLWFWDDDSIRSKSFPGKVLSVLRFNDDDKGDGWKVNLRTFKTDYDQRWKMEGDNLMCAPLAGLEVRHSNQKDGDVVRVNYLNKNLNQRWTFGTYRTFFFILNKKTGKVIDATSNSVIKQWHYHGGKSQLWFWDGNVIRNKQYIDRVIDFNSEGDSYGSLFLNHFKGTQTQEWTYDDNEMLLVSAFNNLTLEVQHESTSDGAVINIKARKTQKWTLTPGHDFFTITSRLNTKVAQTSINTENHIDKINEVNMWSFNGGDNQLWFWDGDNIRSKKFPQKVISLDIEEYNFYKYAKVYLRPYNGSDNQRWSVNGEHIVSFYRNLHLDIQAGATVDGAKVGGTNKTGNVNQMWSQNAKERIFFTIKSARTPIYLQAMSDKLIGIWPFPNGDEGLWFWDKDSIRSKKYPLKVVDLNKHFNKDGLGIVYLQWYNSGQNQKWKIKGQNIISKFRDIYLDRVKAPFAYGQPRTQNVNQRWIIEAVHDKGTGTTSCVDNTEKDIYNVVQWIPLISSLWDLFSSIGYAVAGCNSVAEERAVSMAIGTVMDVATIATGGAASGITSVLKTGVKVGIKFGLKQGMKATVKIAQQSIKHLVQSATKKIAQSGIRKTILQGLKKSGKLIIKEKFIDPAMFLKNAGKLSKKILTHPVRTFKQSWKTAAKKIDDLKQLKKTIDDIRQSDIKLEDGSIFPPKVRCKQSGVIGCLRLKNGYSKDQRRLYKDILDSDKVSKNVDTCANRFMAIKEREYSKLPRHIKDKIDELKTNTEKAEFFAAYKFKENSWRVNVVSQNILKDLPLKPNTQALSKIVDQVFDQIILIQSYLKKRPLKNPKTVYTFERWSMDLFYNTGEVYTAGHLISATGVSDRIKNTVIDQTSKKEFPIELTIYLTKSGANLSNIFQNPTQHQWLIPIGTKFNVQKQNVAGSNLRRVTLTEI